MAPLDVMPLENDMRELQQTERFSVNINFNFNLFITQDLYGFRRLVWNTFFFFTELSFFLEMRCLFYEEKKMRVSTVNVRIFRFWVN